MATYVALDTNILLSAIYFPSRTLREVIQYASSGHRRIVLSDYVIDEAREVVHRKWPDHVDSLDRYIRTADYIRAATVLESTEVTVTIRDPRDLPVIYSAIAAGATILVTGDKDFHATTVPGLAVMTPAQFLNALKE